MQPLMTTLTPLGGDPLLTSTVLWLVANLFPSLSLLPPLSLSLSLSLPPSLSLPLPLPLPPSHSLSLPLPLSFSFSLSLSVCCRSVLKKESQRLKRELRIAKKRKEKEEAEREKKGATGKWNEEQQEEEEEVYIVREDSRVICTHLPLPLFVVSKACQLQS